LPPKEFDHEYDGELKIKHMIPEDIYRLCSSAVKMKAWLEAADIIEGAVFARIFNRRAQRVTNRRLALRNVASIVKAGALKLGFDPATFGGLSLRAGFVTSAVKRGANLIKITDVTGHRSVEMLKTYSRDTEAFVGHAGAGLL
jgi:hypothetical protein